MSDEEFCEEESVSNTSKKGDGNFRKARGEAKKGELDEQLKEYINEWRKQRAKEEEELKRLKEKQAKRKEIRAEQEKKLAQQKKEEEERLRKEEAEKKAKEAEEKRKRLEEAEKKRQEMMKAQKEKQTAAGPGKGGAKKADSGVRRISLLDKLQPISCCSDGQCPRCQERDDQDKGATGRREKDLS